MRISDWSSDVCSSDLARTDWAVHIALAIDGVATVGAVALPGLGLTLRSDQPIAVPVANTPLKMVVSRTRPAAEAVAVAEAIGAELLPMGSAGAKAMAIVRGEIGGGSCRERVCQYV